jgi:hypothetical protein
LFCADISSKNFAEVFAFVGEDFLNVLLALVARFDWMAIFARRTAERYTRIEPNRCARRSNLLAFALETLSDLCDTKFLTEKVL